MAVCCKLMRALAAVVVLAVYSTPQEFELDSALYTTIYGASVAFSNENVTFTCRATGSTGNHIGWGSEQYISAIGSRLEFLSSNDVGTTKVSSSVDDTVAVLARAEVDVVIESRLYIRIQPTIPIASVQCRNFITGVETSITFRLAVNDTSIVCDKSSVCPGEDVTCVCAMGNSNSLAWVTDGSRLIFSSNDRLLQRRNITGSNAYGILTNRYNGSEIEMLTSNLTLVAAMDDTSLLVMCENVDRSTSNLAIIPVIDNCPAPSDQVTTRGGTEAPLSVCNCGPSIGAAIAFALITLLLLLLIVGIVAYMVYKIIGLQKKCDKKDDEIRFRNGQIGSLETKIGEMNDQIGQKNEQIRQKNEQIRQKNEQIRQKDDEIKTLGTKNSDLNDQIGQKNEQIRQKDDEIETLGTKNSDLVTEKKKEISELQRINKELSGRVNRRDQKIQELKHDIAEKDKEVNNLKHDIAEKDKEVNNLEEQIKRLKKRPVS